MVLTGQEQDKVDKIQDLMVQATMVVAITRYCLTIWPGGATEAKYQAGKLREVADNMDKVLQ